MQFVWSQAFNKRYKKLPKKVQGQIKERLELFVSDAFHPLLNNHKLSGEYKDYRSINITGDYRIIYRNQSSEVIFFLAIGTHSELYS